MTARSTQEALSRRSVVVRGLALGAFACLSIGGVVGLHSCNGSGTSLPTVVEFGGPATPLTQAEVFRIIQRAVFALDTPDLHVAVTDRTGEILGVYSTLGATPTDADNIAVSLARTTSFFSNSQAPLSSRTVETLSTYHFPPTFASELLASQVPVSTGAGPFAESVIAPNRRTTGIAGTPQGPLWQINATNRGAAIESAFTTPPTVFNRSVDPAVAPPGEPSVDPFPTNVFYNPSRNINPVNSAVPGSFPSPGITLLPGGVPLFKANANGVLRLVGGVGVYVLETTGLPNVEAGEFAAVQAAKADPTVAADPSFFFDAIPLEGAITIVGILLPYVEQATIPAGFALRDPTTTAPGAFVTNFPVLPPPQVSPATVRDGRPDPFGYLIGPRPGVDGFGGQVLTQPDVQQIINQVVASANITRGQVRLPLGSSAKVIATVVDTRGLILAHYRMEDTLCDAIDVVPAKARTTVYYCRPGGPFSTATTNLGFNFPFGDQWEGFPLGDARGIALTTRTLGFLSQPFYPPGIGGTVNQNQSIPTPAPGNTAPGPLFDLALLNQLPPQTERWGNEPPDPGYQNGLTFFPGSVPLYKNGQLVGALGVSGDGVEQNDLIAFEGGAGFEPPPELRIDNFTFDGVRLPYVKFPETPR